MVPGVFARSSLVFLGLVVSAPIAVAAPEQVAAACELHQIASVPAKLSADNRLLLDATINDVPVKIQLDTGAAVSVLNEKFVTRAGMPLEDVAGVFYGLTGRPLTSKTRIRTMSLGSSVSKDAGFLVTPTGSDGADGGPVGLFGSDYLQNYDVEIDVAGGKVNLFSPDHCPDKLVYWAPEFFKSNIYYLGTSTSHRPAINITVDDNRQKQPDAAATPSGG